MRKGKRQRAAICKQTLKFWMSSLFLSSAAWIVWSVQSSIKELIQKLKQEFKNKYSVLLAPGPNEVNEANQFNAKVILENNEPVNLKTLVSLINSAKLIIANDTGPAHIASHLDKKGLVLFGSHTSAKKVSIENFNFKAISVKNLKELDVNTVLNEAKAKLD